MRRTKMKDELTKRTKNLDNAIAKTDKIIYTKYLKIAKELESKLRKLYQEIEDDGGEILSHLYQYNRYYELLNTIQDELTKLGQYEKSVLENNLIELYKSNYSIINQYGNNFKPNINNNLIKEVVNDN